VTADQASQWLSRVDVPPSFDVVLAPVAPLDPVREPAQTQDALAATASAGATIVSVGRAHDTLAEYLEYLEALAAVHAGIASP
jgi:hypothetical protein